MERDIKLKDYLYYMGKKEALAALLDTKKMAILKTILSQNEELSLHEIATKSQVSLASTFRLLKDFVANDFIERKVWKNNKVYSAKTNETVAFLKELLIDDYDGLHSFLTASTGLPGLAKVILQGKANKSKANLILIGENVDQGKVKQICAEIKTNGFHLSFVILAPDQYEQMVEMGLYAGEKTILKS